MDGFVLERTLDFAIARGLVFAEDRAFVRNLLLDALGLDAPPDSVAVPCGEPLPETITPLLAPLLDDAVARGILPDAPDARDRFSARLCGHLTPAPAAVRERFATLRHTLGARAATDWFYGIQRACDYIRVDRIARNVRFAHPCAYGALEITINLSKPEKDPRDIAAALKAPRVGYPRCMLCAENPGYAGRPGYPARQNHRMIPLLLGGARYYFQYSPYQYYDEHCIVLNERHIPMTIDREAFSRLMDFTDQFPHYFLGSNADLPIVGGSILNHDHFQGGRHVFPMDRAPVRIRLTSPDPRVTADVADWPMSCVRLTSADRDALLHAATALLARWRDYSDPALGIVADDGEKHNTISPAVRRIDGVYVLSLLLRNNRTSQEHPLGIFHPHAPLHHIKKENIGLIEAMGLFILPGRLLGEMDDVRDYLTGARPLADRPDPKERVAKHYDWALRIARRVGTSCTPAQADAAIRTAIGETCERVLADAGVYKRDAAGDAGLLRFLETLGYAPR